MRKQTSFKANRSAKTPQKQQSYPNGQITCNISQKYLEQFNIKSNKNPPYIFTQSYNLKLNFKIQILHFCAIAPLGTFIILATIQQGEDLQQSLMHINQHGEILNYLRQERFSYDQVMMPKRNIVFGLLPEQNLFFKWKIPSKKGQKYEIQYFSKHFINSKVFYNHLFFFGKIGDKQKQCEEDMDKFCLIQHISSTEAMNHNGVLFQCYNLADFNKKKGNIKKEKKSHQIQPFSIFPESLLVNHQSNPILLWNILDGQFKKGDQDGTILWASCKHNEQVKIKCFYPFKDLKTGTNDPQSQYFKLKTFKGSVVQKQSPHDYDKWFTCVRTYWKVNNRILFLADIEKVKPIQAEVNKQMKLQKQKLYAIIYQTDQSGKIKSECIQYQICPKIPKKFKIFTDQIRFGDFLMIRAISQSSNQGQYSPVFYINTHTAEIIQVQEWSNFKNWSYNILQYENNAFQQYNFINFHKQNQSLVTINKKFIAKESDLARNILTELLIREGDNQNWIDLINETCSLIENSISYDKTPFIKQQDKIG